MAADIPILAALLAGGEPSRAVIVTEPAVRLVDLVDLASVPPALRKRAARLEVAAMSRGVAQTLSRAFVLARVRAQLPLLAQWSDRHVAAGYVVTYRPPATATAKERCLRAQRDVPEGSVLRSGDFVSADCAKLDRARPLYRYVTGERSVRARRAIAAGSVVPRFAGYGRTAAYAGDVMTLSASSGPVTVSRRVRVLQSAREGERLFAQSPDGDVFSAPFRGAPR